MISRIGIYSKRIFAVLSQHRSPNQIAWGVAVGIALGLIPKDNLVALLLIATIACVRVNQMVACTTAVGLWLTAGWFEPITVSLGNSVLSRPFYVQALIKLYQYPVLPWTCLENAAVIGGMLAGLASLLPTYAICRWLLSKAKQQLDQSALEQIANDAIRYRKSLTDQARVRHEMEPSLKLVSDMDATTEELATDGMESMDEPAPPIHSISNDSSSNLEATDAPRELIRFEPIDSSVQRPTKAKKNSSPDQDTILRETVIEVVRYRHPKWKEDPNSPSPTDAPSEAPLPIAQDSLANPSPQVQGPTMPVVNLSIAKTNGSNNKDFVRVNSTTTVGQSITIEPAHAIEGLGVREESLKYLLRHINGNRDSSRKTPEKSA